MIDLLDTHQHLLYRDHFDYLWSESVPALAKPDFTVSDYAALTEGRGVAGSIFMEVDAKGATYQDEARHIAQLAKHPAAKILGVISSCRPEDDAEFDQWLEECADLPVVGMRRILHEISDDTSKPASFRANVAKLGKRGLTFDMCFRADQLGLAVELARACPDTSMVLDHCGVPDIAGGGFEHWSAGIAEVAKLPNVACKISGVLTYCKPANANIDAIRPYVSHVIAAFGPDRLIWGSDWPVVNINANLPDWITIFRSLIADLSEQEQIAICYGNAQRIYGVTL